MLVATLAEIVIAGLSAASRCTLVSLVGVQVVVLRGQAVVVLALVQHVVQLEVVFRPGAVTGAVGRAVGHHAGLQAAIPPHGPVQVQPCDQRLSDVDAFGPVDWIIVHGWEGALKTDCEDQLLLLHVRSEEKEQFQ